MIKSFYGNTGSLPIVAGCRTDEAERLRIVFNGKRVCLVAQGESVLKVKRREFVDAHELVVRMNHFRLDGYQDYIGSRTDVHAFTNHSGFHSPEACAARWFYFADGFALESNQRSMPSDDRVLFWSRPPRDYDDFLAGKWPTTGLRILIDVLEAGAKSVTLLGYDFYQNSCYYFAPIKAGEIPLSDGLKDWQPDSEHDPEKEKEYARLLVARDARIKIL